MSVQYPELSLFIDGKQLSVEGRQSEQVVNPATEEVIGVLPHADAADLDHALAVTQEGFAQWRATPPDERSRILKKAADIIRARADELAEIASMESGKVFHGAKIEALMSAGIFEWYGEEGRRAYGRVLRQAAPGTRMYVVKEPVGPVAAFAPWNFPLGNPARKFGAALGAGCSCILKPAEETPASALLTAQILVEAGVPEKAIAVVFGVPAQVSSHLIASPTIRKISFTGSIPVGKQLMKLAADGMKRTTMELGGHAPVLVFDDVDVDAVLDLAVAAKFRGCGQVCISPTRFYVHEKIHGKFVEGFTERTKKLKIGDPVDKSVQVGPMIHARRVDAIEALVKEARESGGKINTGGTRIDGKGYFHQPTVLSNVPESARIMAEEPFGPVAIINSFSDFDEVIALANKLPYGLAAYAFTDSAKRVKLLGERLESGMVGLNTFQISVPASPFGGVKESGHGSEEGIEGLEACLVTKFIHEG